MRKMSKTLIAIMTLLVAISLISTVCVADDGFQYETVGGEISSIDLVTVFLFPALIIVSVFGAMIILALIRVKHKTDA